MPEPPVEDFVSGLLRRELAGERTTVQIGPYTAVLLITAINDVLRRYADQLGEHGPQMYQRIRDQLTLMFANDPLGSEFIHQDRRPPAG